MTATAATLLDRLSLGLALAAWLGSVVLVWRIWTFPITPILIAIPVGVAGLPLLMHSQRGRQPARIIASLLLFMFAYVEVIAGIGLLFLPAVCVTMAAVVTGRGTSSASRASQA